jgi:hypothetical protein
VLNPLTPIPVNVYIMTTLVVGLCLLSVDILLLCRVFAVVPPSRTSWAVLAAVYTFPILNKIARSAILVVYCVHFARDARQHSLGHTPSLDTSKNQAVVDESFWFITAADNV